MAKWSSIQENLAEKVIIYGEPKTGKTTLVAKLLFSGFKLHWINMDNGCFPIIKKLGLSPTALDEQLNIITLPDTQDYPIASSVCRKIIKGEGDKGGPILICDTHGQVDCMKCKGNGNPISSIHPNIFGPKEIIVFDHVGVLTRSAYHAVMNKKKVQMKIADEDPKMDWDDWRLQGALLDRFFVGVQNARFNIICIAHVIEGKGEDGVKKLYPEIGTSNYSINSGGFFGHVIYSHAQNGTVRYGSRVGYSANALTGSRLDFNIEELKDKPSIEDIFSGAGLAENYGAHRVTPVLAAKK